MSVLECNRTVQTSMLWSAFKVAIKKDPNSQTGLIEELTEIQINETVRSYQSSLIDIPGLTLDVGLHKLVFKLEIETGVPGLPLYKTAYTYFNVTQSPLVPAFTFGENFLYDNPVDPNGMIRRFQVKSLFLLGAIH